MDEEEWSLGEEFSDLAEEVFLILTANFALLRWVDEEENNISDILQSGDGLHFDLITIGHRTVE
jgi:hypothetical protein